MWNISLSDITYSTSDISIWLTFILDAQKPWLILQSSMKKSKLFTWEGNLELFSSLIGRPLISDLVPLESMALNFFSSKHCMPYILFILAIRPSETKIRFIFLLLIYEQNANAMPLKKHPPQLSKSLSWNVTNLQLPIFTKSLFVSGRVSFSQQLIYCVNISG